LVIGHRVDLDHEVLVGLLRLLTSPSVAYNKKINYAENGNYMKKMRVNVTFPLETP
jgi:hypothetical protein